MFPSQSNSLPNVSSVLDGWEQNVTFVKVTQTLVDFQVVDTLTNYTFRGVVQPFSPKELEIKPEGERGWEWLMIHSKTALSLNVGEYITYNNLKYRVMQSNDYAPYGYYQYHIVKAYE